MKARLARFALLMPLVAGSSQGQMQAHPVVDAAGARALLESPQLAEKAWGGYWAAQLREPGLNESMVAQLRWAERLRDSQTGSEGHACIQSHSCPKQ